MFPAKDKLTILFAHVAYRMQERFALRNTGIASIEARTRDEVDARIGQADVLLCSGLWRNDLIPRAPKLRFVQSISAGTDQYDKPALSAAGIRLASAAGVNARAVSEHAMALILALARRLPEARDNQTKQFWRGMIGDLSGREDELGGKTLLIVGRGRIGNRLAELAKAFDMHVLATRRDPALGGDAHEVHGLSALKSLLPQADFVILTVPHTPATEGFFNATKFGQMKRTAFFINIGRGMTTKLDDLVAALEAGKIAGAALDVFEQEPLPAEHPLWGMPNVLLTPHMAGYGPHLNERRFQIIQDNCRAFANGETLRNVVDKANWF